jgi:hypothetical protein
MSSLARPTLSLLLGLPVAACTSDPGSDDDTDASTAVTLSSGNDTSTSGDPPQGCKSDAECEGNPAGPVCDEADGLCYPECEPGDADDCYDGLPATLGVGPCSEGVRTCSSDGTWGLCSDQVLPSDELCGNDIDENCDGSLLGEDKDGDGWSTCDGDCCDDELIGCIDAELVNPGAFEVEGNELDDDCDGMTDEVAASCDANLSSDSSIAMHYAQAIELCQTTVEDAPLPERSWGVISAQLRLADGTAMPLPVQRSIRQQFGDNIGPSGGDSLVVLSSGAAAAPGQTSPNYAAFESGQDLGTSVDLGAPASVLSDWIDANGGEFPASCDGVNPTADTAANDSVMLSLRIRVPTNARSFTTRMFFFTAEYPEWVCSQYNDFFVTLLDSSEPSNPADKNIAVYDDGQQLWPVGLNILKTAPGLFAVCQSGNVGCQGDLPQVMYSCPDGAELLAGTGFDAIDTGNSCNGVSFPAGGGTGWLIMSGNVTPGEIVDVRFALWDAGGHLFDALVLLDDWQWSLDAASPGVTTP